MLIGPVVSPVLAGGARKEPERARRSLVAGGDLVRRFVQLPLRPRAFHQFAEEYGLLGVADLPLVEGHEARPAEPFVLWLQHYNRLRSLEAVLLRTGNFDRREFEADQMTRSAKAADTMRTLTRRFYGDWPGEWAVPDFSGAVVSGRFECACPTFSSAPDRELRREALEVLTDQLSAHCRIGVRPKNRRKRLKLDDELDRMDLGDRLVIATTLEPKGLVGSFYIGLLMAMSGPTFIRKVRACQECGKPMLEARPNKKYCDERCKQLAKRGRARGTMQTDA